MASVKVYHLSSQLSTASTQTSIKYHFGDAFVKRIDAKLILLSLLSINMMEIKNTGGRFTRNLKITIHTEDIFILLEKHHQRHCKPTNNSYHYRVKSCSKTLVIIRL